MNSVYAFRFVTGPKASARDVLMVFSATPTLDAEALATVVEAEIEANLVPDELFIVVREPQFDATRADLAAAPLHTATLARLRDRATVTLAGYNRRGEECRREHIKGPAATRRIDFDDFRRRAVTSIFNLRHGFVESTPTYHFENPSGRHTERFIRLSNILARGAEIAFIGFAALPHVPEGTRIAYLDTPSLYAVVAAINEQLASFEGIEPILADNFSSYAGVEDYRFTQIADAFVLISASSSGSLARHLIEQHGFEPKQIAHLLFLGDDKSKSRIVCDLSRSDTRNPEGVDKLPAVEEEARCRMCRGGSFAIKLKGDQFEFAGPQQDPLLISKNDGPDRLAELMARYAGGGLFGIGFGNKPGARQFSINHAALLELPAFRERLDYALRRSLPGSVEHVIAIDEWSVPIARHAADFTGRDIKPLGRDELSQIPEDTTSAILIAAAVIESGRSLLDISRDLRSVAAKAPLLYLVGFSKTSGEARREALSRHLEQTVNPFPYQMIEVEKMVLPPSSEDNAWEAELRLFRDPDVSALIPENLRKAINARVEILRRIASSMSADLFVANSERRRLTLQPGFVFWPDGLPREPHSEADIFFTIASVLQNLRANAGRGKKPAIKSNWFQQTILAAGNFGRFNDDIIQASILRAAYPAEMNLADAPDESRDLGRLIRRVIMSAGSARGGAAAEFLIALASRRLQLRSPDLEAVLSAEAGSHPLVAFLQAVCRARLQPMPPPL